MKYTEAQKAVVKDLQGAQELIHKIRNDLLKKSGKVRIENGFIILNSAMNFKY